MIVAPKDPDAEKDYRFKWADWLASGETIASAVITVESGLTLEATSIEDSSTSVLGWFSGGTAGEKYQVTCQITTDSTPARIEQKSVYVEVAEQ
jgi:hypothetical protein